MNMVSVLEGTRARQERWEADYQMSRRALAGDAKAMAGLFEAVEVYIRRYLRKLMMYYQIQEADMEDAVQDALAACFQKLEEFEGRALFTTWAYGFVRFNALRICGRRRRNREQAMAAWNLSCDGYHNPVKAVLSYEVRQAVWASLEHLTVEEYASVILRWQMRLSYRKIAAVTKVNVYKAKRNAAAARQKFLAHFDEVYGLSNYFS